MTKRRPFISIIVPTMNCQMALADCLSSVKAQDYPQELLEIIVVDGGSLDETLEVANEFKAEILQNPRQTAEAGKALGLRVARGDLVAFLDSDNILSEADWLTRMVEPFGDSEILGTEPIKFTWRQEDGFIDRYCALIGVNDPLVMFFGNYDRINTLSGVWTELEIEQRDKGPYLELSLHRGLLPTIGANGTILRRDLFRDYEVGEYFFDIDFLYDLLNREGYSGSRKFAKVKIGIVHRYCGSDLGQFIRKQRRRVRDYLYYEQLGIRKYPWRIFSWNSSRGHGALFFIVANLTVLPLLFQSLLGFWKKRDWAWFFHPLACALTLWVYGYNWMRKQIFGLSIADRTRYGQ